MSGIFGIFNRNDTPVDQKIVNTILDGISYWEPDDRGTWLHGPVALGHTMLWNTPESKFEHLPNKQDHLAITMDARLDNREELAEQLDITNRPLEQITDSDFILAAYQKWGAECPKYLLGDFAFAIWDEKKQQLFCTRDHIGVKQFYFHLTDTLFVFSNDLKGLVKHPELPKEINDEAVANFLVNSQLISTTLTFFKEIEKLPPAHTLILTASKVHQKCYWRLEDAPKIKLSDTKAYAKKLRELLEQAVYDRIRSTYPITSHLSGGLDSSSLAVIAARKLKEKKKRLIAFNWLHEPQNNDDPDHYEWKNSKHIANIEGIKHHYIALNTKDMYQSIKGRNIVFGNTTAGWYESNVRNNAQQQGVRTILSGWGGDELITYHGQSYYSDLLGRFKLNKLFIELIYIAKLKKWEFRSILSFIFRKLLIPRIPRSYYCYLPKITCDDKNVSELIKKEFAPFVKREINKIQILTEQPYPTIKQHMLAYFKYGHIQSRIDSWAASAMESRLEYSFPLLDKRVVEFALGIPPEFFVHYGVGRYLYKKAVEELVPDEILWKDHKIELKRGERLLLHYSELFKMQIEELNNSDIDSDYVDIAKLKYMLQKTKSFCLKNKDNEIRQIMEIMALMRILNININQK